ncbi:hypothetical protein MTR67_042369 [Solanum verrucosum]|uniref:Uncharacterized protein n=1 Tax=Solanum verrucosum TaxID=315347 RepID=A0AAF0UN61_SOLVR|nr:hypothetical protein MTR67_042369 [Solanum verrucosum]
MALKVVFVLFLAMLLFTNDNNGESTVGDYALCLGKCFTDRGCFLSLTCQAGCALFCATGESVNKVKIQTRVCNVGCSLGYCYKFLINKYDHDKFGSCMTSCNENYCINDNNNIALPKA